MLPKLKIATEIISRTGQEKAVAVVIAEEGGVPLLKMRMEPEEAVETAEKLIKVALWVKKWRAERRALYEFATQQGEDLEETRQEEASDQTKQEGENDWVDEAFCSDKE